MKTEYKIITGIVLLTLIIIVGGAWLSGSKTEQEQIRLSNSSLGEKIPIMTSNHIALGTPHEPYNTNPPTSGPHLGNQTAGAGIKTKPVADEIVVHSLEHGAVVVWHKNDIEQVELDKIRNAFNSASGKKIMMPRTDLDVPVALTSWGHILKLETVDEGKIIEFIETNSDRAPEKAPI